MSESTFNFNDELKELFEEGSDSGIAFMKFFRLFNVKLQGKDDGSLTYGKDSVDEEINQKYLVALRDYIREQRKWVSDHNGKPESVECRRRIWFFVHKLVEIGAFDRTIRRDIMWWMDVCMERTFEGTQVRIESVRGEPRWARGAGITNAPVVEHTLPTTSTGIEFGYFQ